MQPKQIELEETIYNISTQFVKLQNDQIDNGIINALKVICKQTDTIRGSVFIFSDNYQFLTNTHEWCEKKSESQNKLLQNIPTSYFSYYIKKLMKHKDIIISSMDDLLKIKANYEKEWAIKYGFRPHLFVPMISIDGLFGTLGFYGRINEKRKWDKKLISLLKFTANMIMNLLERKKIEDKLKKSYRNLEAVIENTDECIQISNEKCKPVLWNSAFENIIYKGMGKRMKPGMIPHYSFKNKKTIEMFKNIHKKVLAGEKISIDFTYDFGRGDIEHFETSYYPIKEGNKIIGFSEYTRNITKRKNAENRLRENEKLLRTIADNLPNAFITIIKKGFIFEFTAGDTLNSYGIKSEELKGHNIGDLKNTNTEFIKEEFQKTFNGKRTVFELKINNKYLLYQSAPLRDEMGNINKILTVVQDITEIKNMEEQLRQSEKMQAIGQLAGGIAHDFNNQLAAIVGYADILREEIENDEVLKQYTENILIASKRSSDLTNQLLAFARRGNYISANVNIHDTINEIISLLKHTIDKRIKIKKEFNASPCNTIGDPTQIQNMLLNLALNARDAIHKNGELTFITDTVILCSEFCYKNPFEIEPGEFLFVSVTDTGIGMDSETQKHIFEPFFTTKENGTGMGMAAVYGTVKSHKGAIEIISGSGQGTEAKIYLPLIQDEVINETSIKQTGNKNKILFIDDELLVCDIIKDIFLNTGYKIDVCYNNKDAFTFYSENTYDLVIIDLKTQETDGETTFLELKKINPDIKAIFYSDYNETASKLPDNKKYCIIPKPYRKSYLLKIVTDILNK